MYCIFSFNLTASTVYTALVAKLIQLDVLPPFLPLHPSSSVPPFPQDILGYFLALCKDI